jgi:hypothetical protein
VGPAAAIGSEDVAQLASSARDCVPRARFCGVDVDALAGVGGQVEGLLRQRQVTHQDKRHAEELKAAADDLLSRLDQ